MKRISNTEYVTIDKAFGRIRLWHDCKIVHRKREFDGRAELLLNESGDAYVCPSCGMVKPAADLAYLLK